MVTITTSMCATSHYFPRKAAGLPGRVPVWEAKLVMGIPLCSRLTGPGIGEAVPPAYSAYVVEDFLQHGRGHPPREDIYVPPPKRKPLVGDRHAPNVAARELTAPLL